MFVLFNHISWHSIRRESEVHNIIRLIVRCSLRWEKCSHRLFSNSVFESLFGFVFDNATDGRFTASTTNTIKLCFLFTCFQCKCCCCRCRRYILWHHRSHTRENLAKGVKRLKKLWISIKISLALCIPFCISISMSMMWLHNSPTFGGYRIHGIVFETMEIGERKNNLDFMGFYPVTPQPEPTCFGAEFHSRWWNDTSPLIEFQWFDSNSHTNIKDETYQHIW